MKTMGETTRVSGFTPSSRWAENTYQIRRLPLYQDVFGPFGKAFDFLTVETDRNGARRDALRCCFEKEWNMAVVCGCW